jgi:hypothetical protein
MNGICDHKFVYAGIKYEVQDWKIPGGGSQPVWYFDWFYCEKCLENKYHRLAIERDTYEKTMFGASPK